MRHIVVFIIAYFAFSGTAFSQKSFSDILRESKILEAELKAKLGGRGKRGTKREMVYFREGGWN